MKSRLHKKHPELKELANIDDNYRLKVEKTTAKRILAGESENVNLANAVSVDVFMKCAENEQETVSKIVSSFM